MKLKLLGSLKWIFTWNEIFLYIIFIHIQYNVYTIQISNTMSQRIVDCNTTEITENNNTIFSLILSL